MAARKLLSIVRKSGNRFSEKTMLEMKTTSLKIHIPASAGFSTH